MRQPSKTSDQKKRQALLIVDMINDFRFDDGRELFSRALTIGKKIVKLRERAHIAGVPVIYVNDNFAKWHDTFQTTIETIEHASEEGSKMISLMRPEKDDYYVLKPDRSGFYETPLEILLEDLDVTDVIITGVTTDICVLFTAHDAHMRGLGVAVPADCTTATTTSYKRQALRMLERVADADTRPSDKIRFVRKKK